MLTNEQLKTDCEKFSKEFLLKTMDMCKKEDMSLGHTLHHMQQKMKLCQTMMFCFMAEIRKEDSIASIYGDMKEMALEPLNTLVEHPEIFEHFGSMNGSAPEQSTVATVELFKSLHKAMKDGPTPIR